MSYPVPLKNDFFQLNLFNKQVRVVLINRGGQSYVQLLVRREMSKVIRKRI